MNHDALIKAGIIKDLTKQEEKEKVLPKEGTALARLIEYVEIGEHPKSKKYPNPCHKARLVFELVTPQHRPNEDKGIKFPFTVSMTYPIYTDPKSNYIKLFNSLNWSGNKQHFIQMIGELFLCKVDINKTAEATYVNLKDFGAPRKEDALTGEITEYPAEAAINPVKLFLWNLPDHALLKTMWDTLYIEGETGEGKSKNWLQELMQKSLDFEQSELNQMLNGGLDLPTDLEGIV